MLDRIIDQAFKRRPQKPLYHYTGYSGLMGIVENKSFRLTDYRYLNDRKELRELADFMQMVCGQRMAKFRSNRSHLEQGFPDLSSEVHFAGELSQWLSLEFGREDYSLFVGSFTEEGNLLSQWRGYCPYGKGVSIGFRSDLIENTAIRCGLRIGMCVYGVDEANIITNSIFDELWREWQEKIVLDDFEGFRRRYFQKVHGPLLTIASLIKHHDFREEKEWRAVLPAQEHVDANRVRYREGVHSLVPYIEMPLLADGSGKLLLENVNIGPTDEEELALKALEGFLSHKANCKMITRTWSPLRSK